MMRFAGRMGLVAVTAMVLAAGACSSPPSAGTAPVDSDGVDPAVTTSAPTRPSLPGPGSKGGEVKVENPCDAIVTVHVRLTPPGEEGEPPDVMKRIREGKTAFVTGYAFAADAGPHDVLVTAPELSWVARKPAPMDHSQVTFVIDKALCPAAD